MSSTILKVNFVLLCTLITMFLAGCSESEKPLPTVDQVSLTEYAGTWYEIASFPNRFQKGCTCTTATYGKADGYVSVKNRCYKEGEWTEIEGKAFPVENSNNTKLKVQFFWPFRGDYFIIALDDDYQYVMVGNPTREYLWILSRTPELKQSVIDKLKSKAEKLGFDTGRLVSTPQNCD